MAATSHRLDLMFLARALLGLVLLCGLSAVVVAVTPLSVTTHPLDDKGTIPDLPPGLYDITLHKADIADGAWVYIEGAVTDPKGTYELGFGDSLWYETGRDSDGPWSEGDYSYTAAVKLPRPGPHTLTFTVQVGRDKGYDPTTYTNKSFTVTVSRYWAAPPPLLAMAFGALVLALFVFHRHGRREMKRLARGRAGPYPRWQDGSDGS